MRTFLRFVAILIASVGLSRGEIPVETRQDLGKLVPEVIRLLEAKEYVPVLKAVVPPETLKKLTEKQSLEKFAEEFGKDKAATLLAALKAVKDVKPKMSEDGSKAEFGVPDGAGEEKRGVIFKRVDKNWYIQN